MIDPNRVTEAVMEFMKNPSWKEIFTNAPGGAMERLAISFYFSKFHDQFQAEDFQEYRDLRDEYEKSLTEEDLNYLIENSDKDNAKKHYQELLAKLQQSGGQPQGKMRFEKGEGEEKQSEGQTQNGGEEQPQAVEEKVEETEAKETPNGEETEKETVVAEEKPAEQQPKEEGGEKKKDLTENGAEPEKDEKYDTALSVALEYLQNEQKKMEEKGEKGKIEPPKTN